MGVWKVDAMSYLSTHCMKHCMICWKLLENKQYHPFSLYGINLHIWELKTLGTVVCMLTLQITKPWSSTNLGASLPFAVCCLLLLLCSCFPWRKEGHWIYLGQFFEKALIFWSQKLVRPWWMMKRYPLAILTFTAFPLETDLFCKGNGKSLILVACKNSW